MLCTKLEFHAQTFKDWLKTGGPINPMWARDTAGLRRELHRAQCRAAQRIFSADQEANSRCLGAFLVYRRLREQKNERRRTHEERESLPQWQQQQIRHEEQRRLEAENPYEGARGLVAGEAAPRRLSLEALVPDCNRVGNFERFGERDIVFVCDYCDGHLVWEDVDSMPAARASPNPPTNTGYPNWRAVAQTMSTGEEKTIVFAPLVIANHLAAGGGIGWEARIWCPFCDDYTYYEHTSDDQTKYAQEEGGFDDLPSFQEHLEWHHTAMTMPALPAMPALPTLPTLRSSVNNCTVM